MLKFDFMLITHFFVFLWQIFIKFQNSLFIIMGSLKKYLAYFRQLFK